jgi:steroid delta-isomerase-like uncharacterized protein
MRNKNLSAYFNAWNAHDCDALRATFTIDGIYTDPSVGEVSGKKPEAYAEHLWRAFPDLKFEISSHAEISADKLIAEWVMTGTNTGSLNNLPPTGKPVLLKGVDIIEVGEDGIKSVMGYFDSKVVPMQLGLNVIVQPTAVGPFGFGSSVAVQSGKKTKPGAFSITSIWNDQDETAEIQSLSRETMKEMMSMEGFIGITTARLGGRGITVTAWEKPENVSQVMTSPSHREAMKKFWPNLSSSAYTSVWIPHHINPLWVRCSVCSKMNDSEKSVGTCSCGEALPEAPSYF